MRVTRAWKVWVVYACAAALAAGGLWVLTRRLYAVDREARETIAQQRHELAVALAMWRLEGEAAAVLADITAFDAAGATAGGDAGALPWVGEPTGWSTGELAALDDNAYGGANRDAANNGVLTQQQALDNGYRQVDGGGFGRGGRGDTQQRTDAYESQLRGNILNAGNNARLTAPPLPEDAALRLGVFEYLRVDEALYVARPSEALGDAESWRGYRLNEPAIVAALLESTDDLLPRAALVPVNDPGDAPLDRQLATLPLALVPGPAPAVPAGDATLRTTVAVAWGALALTLLGVGLALGSIVRLSQRRAAFVAAVTHEMRTPLTTFQMYTEMLDSGMVSDAARAGYVATLRSEAGRLHRLIENVLAFARLERQGSRGQARGNGRGRAEPVALGAVLPAIAARLVERVEAAGGSMTVTVDDDASAARVAVRAETLEQVLGNLVDNACKYGRGADGLRVELSAERSADTLRLTVRDHGPGVAPADRARLFRAFERSASPQHDATPGIGLGLSLSRRLARGLGGELGYGPGDGDGASFTLTLPMQA